MASASAVLRFDDVSLHFGDAVALDHVSFEMGPGESRVVFGAAGAGKTTLLKVALGLVKPDSGHVYTFGQDATDLPEIKWYDIRSKMGVLFQEGGLFDSLTIGENVAYPLLNQHSVGRDTAGKTDVSQNGNVEKIVRETLRFVELEQTIDKFPSELSGGMRRRVGIARAIVTEPQLVLYDSPTAGLDPITANLIITLILKERDTRNEASILVTHRYQDGHLMANFRYNPHSGQIERIPEDGAGNNPRGNEVKTKFFVMNEGRLVFAGTQAELKAAQDPYVRKFVK